MQEPISIAPKLAAHASTAYVKAFFAVTKKTWKEARNAKTLFCQGMSTAAEPLRHHTGRKQSLSPPPHS